MEEQLKIVSVIEIKNEIKVGNLSIKPLPVYYFKNELVKYEDGSIAFRYTERRNFKTITKSPIVENSKTIWQKAQQQQD